MNVLRDRPIVIASRGLERIGFGAMSDLCLTMMH